MKRFIVGYSFGVITAPVVYYKFRKPIAKHILVPMTAREDVGESLMKFMLIRNDYIDHKKQEGEE